MKQQTIREQFGYLTDVEFAELTGYSLAIWRAKRIGPTVNGDDNRAQCRQNMTLALPTNLQKVGCENVFRSHCILI